MRDMLAGFRIRDLDFVVEGAALKLAKAICDQSGAKIAATDENRKCGGTGLPQRRDGADRHVAAGKIRAHRSQAAGYRRPPSRKICAAAISRATPSRYRSIRPRAGCCSTR